MSSSASSSSDDVFPCGAASCQAMTWRMTWRGERERDVNISLCIYIYPPTSSKARACYITLSLTNTLQSCRLQSAITAIPCNLPFCYLQTTCTAKCTLPHCIILKGYDFRDTGLHRLPQDAPGRPTFWPQSVSNHV